MKTYSYNSVKIGLLRKEQLYQRHCSEIHSQPLYTYPSKRIKAGFYWPKCGPRLYADPENSIPDDAAPPHLHRTHSAASSHTVKIVSEYDQEIP